LPARAVHKTAVNQNDVLHSCISFSCSIVWRVFANWRSLRLYSRGVSAAGNAKGVQKISSEPGLRGELLAPGAEGTLLAEGF
jgi:hypothetical protein